MFSQALRDPHRPVANRREARCWFSAGSSGKRSTNICITVVDIDRGKIRLGIEAPRDVPIYRQELLPLNHPRPDAAAAATPTAAAS
jgi:carbon storage regulator